MKTALVSSVLLASLTSFVAPQDPGVPQLSPNCPNVLPHEPLLLFEIRGSTLAAQVDRTLTVYADGSAKLAEASATGPGKCMTVPVDPEAMTALRQALVAAGAFALCDDARTVTDVPLRTLTVLGNGQTARAHTFSYWLANAGYEGVDLELEQFIAEQFPKF